MKKQTKKNEKRLWNVSKTKRKKGMKNERKLKIDTRKKNKKRGTAYLKFLHEGKKRNHLNKGKRKVRHKENRISQLIHWR